MESGTPNQPQPSSGHTSRTRSFYRRAAMGMCVVAVGVAGFLSGPAIMKTMGLDAPQTPPTTDLTIPPPTAHGNQYGAFLYVPQTLPSKDPTANVVLNLNLTPVTPGSRTLTAAIPSLEVDSLHTQPWNVTLNAGTVTGVTNEGTQTSIPNATICFSRPVMVPVLNTRTAAPTINRQFCLPQGGTTIAITSDQRTSNTGFFGENAGSATITLPPGSPSVSAAMVSVDLSLG